MVRPYVAVALIVTLAAIASVKVNAADPLSVTDRTLLRRAFAAGDVAKWKTAFEISSQVRNQLLVKVLRWLYMTKSGNEASFEEISGFIEHNPDWPLRISLRRRAEKAMTNTDKGKLPPTSVIDWLDRYPPLTTQGRLALLAARFETGETERANSLARRIWVHSNLRGAPERRLLRRFRRVIGSELHQRRLDRLLWDERWADVQRMLPRVGSADRALARARMRLAQRRGGVDAAILRVPTRLQHHPGLLYERTRWRRRKGRVHDAFEMLTGLPDGLPYAERWWTERAIIARRKLVEGKHLEAFKLTANHGMWPGSVAFANAEWMTGWLALRYLDRPAEALLRFERLHATVRYPISRARAAYWAGRAAMVLQNLASAREWYHEAARFGETFYGQIASRVISKPYDPNPAPELIQDPTKRDAFENHELVRAIPLLEQIGQDRLVQLFATRLACLENDPRRMRTIAELLRDIGRRDIAVGIARYAYRKGVTIIDAAYPLIDMPKTEIEPALMLAIARQESNFAVNAISHSGARGMMQIMPATARATARKTKQRYSRARLTKDANYNIRLAMAHLEHLLQRYDNNYVLAIVAYNAGQRTTSRWVRAFGNPGDPKVDVIDWMETIPFAETRNYVQRVLEGLELYRSRLSAPRPAPWLGPAMNKPTMPKLIAETRTPADIVNFAP